jgi:PleD family two-component response regulator
MGVAIADGKSAPEPQSFLHQADISLYTAKKNGRNRVEQVDEVAELPQEEAMR